MRTLTLKTLFALIMALGISTGLNAQTRNEKAMETFNVEDGVLIKVDAAFTNFIIETWNKDQVQVEAFIQTDKELTEAERKQALENWNLDIMGNSEQIHISSSEGNAGFPNIYAFSAMPNIQNYSSLSPQINTMLSPMLESLSQMHIMPPSFPQDFFENMGGFKFDYQAYKKDGEAYLKEYEKLIKESFGEDFKEDMAEWAESFSMKMKERQEMLEKRQKEMAAQRSDMDELREKMEKEREEMKQQAEKIAQKLQERAAKDPHATYSTKTTIGPNGEKTVSWSYSTSHTLSSENKGRKMLIIKIPETARLDLDVRHGKVNLEGTTTNLEANLSHTPFTAEKIEGKHTQINLSYAPVKIENWENGLLSLRYIGDCNIENVQHIKLKSNMSDLRIGNIEKSGMLRGSFGELNIEKVGSKFENLNIDLQNSALNLKLPNTAFNFDYDGAHSNIQLPKSLKVETKNNHGQTYISGYNRSENNSGRISIEANFSEVKISD